MTVWRKNKVVCLPYRKHRTESRWIKVLNFKSKTIKKAKGRNHGGIFGLGVGKDI